MYENIFTGLQRRTISGGISETKFYRYNHNMQISKNVESMSAMRRNWSIVRRQQFGGVSQMSSLLAWPIKTIGLVVGVVLSASAAQAATVTLNFGNSPGSYHPYQESGYNVSASANGTGSVVLDDSTGQCPFADPACLHVSGSNPGTAFIERQNGSLFDAFSLAINFSGNGNTNFVQFDNGSDTIALALGSSYSGGVYTTSAESTLVTGLITKGTSYFIDLAALAVADGKLSTFFSNIPELSIETSGGAANVRVDNVAVSAAVPVPAGGLLLLGGLGTLALLRRRKSV
jgi:hypothetical protein